MNRIVVFGLAIFFAIVGIALLGGNDKAMAFGHRCCGGCNGCNGGYCGGNSCCGGGCHHRHHGHRCSGRCHGCNSCSGYSCNGGGCCGGGGYAAPVEKQAPMPAQAPAK